MLYPLLHNDGDVFGPHQHNSLELTKNSIAVENNNNSIAVDCCYLLKSEEKELDVGEMALGQSTCPMLESWSSFEIIDSDYSFTTSDTETFGCFPSLDEELPFLCHPANGPRSSGFECHFNATGNSSAGQSFDHVQRLSNSVLRILPSSSYLHNVTDCQQYAIMTRNSNASQVMHTRQRPGYERPPRLQCRIAGIS